MKLNEAIKQVVLDEEVTKPDSDGSINLSSSYISRITVNGKQLSPHQFSFNEGSNHLIINIKEVNEASNKAKIFDGNNKKIALNPEAIKTAVLKTGQAKAVIDEDHDISILYDRDEDMIEVYVDDTQKFSGHWSSLDKAILQFIKHINKAS